MSAASAGASFARDTPLPATTESSAFQLVSLVPLMRLTEGAARVKVALIDGPVRTGHPGLAGENIRVLGADTESCSSLSSAACRHGTFIAGMLAARRGSDAPALCPVCTLLVRPLFSEQTETNGKAPSVHADLLAASIVDAVNSGAKVINLSAALGRSTGRAERKLRAALDYAGRQGAVIVAATGNGGTVGGSVIVSHPWVLPVAACGLQGRPAAGSNFGASKGRNGLLAPGVQIRSLAPDGSSVAFSGTSVSTPFVTGTFALLLCAFPKASPSQVKLALTQSAGVKRSTIVPPLLNAQAALNVLRIVFPRNGSS